WDCVTCGACVEACPVSIEHIDHIVDLRRSRVMVDSKFPAEAEPMLRDVERAGNPWGKPQTERAAWSDSLGVRVLEPGDPAPEYLYWVGCAASFDERAKKSAEATAKLLQKADVDFAILGPREACTGDPARRMGNEYVFQAYAEHNVATLNEQRVRKIVASCPHCFNTLANEYGDFGGNYEVLHHTELLAELVDEGKLQPKADAKSITYHDSCYLARHNDVRLEPRKLLNVIGQPVEMKRSGKQTFCCGAGGAHMWMEEKGKAINVERATEAIGTGAETLAVACPFCTVMLDDGVRETGSITVSVTASGLVPSTAVEVWLDTDKNSSTGSPCGCEFNLEIWQGADDWSWTIDKWSGTAWVMAPESPDMRFSRSGDVFTWTFNKSDLGGANGFAFWAGGYLLDATGDNVRSSDYAPDGGTWRYDLSGPAVQVTTAIGKPVAVPAKPRAGKLLSLAFPVTRSDNGALPAGA